MILKRKSRFRELGFRGDPDQSVVDHKRSNGRSSYRTEEELTLLRSLVVVVPCGPRLRPGNPVTGLSVPGTIKS